MAWSIVGLGEILWDIFPDGAKFGGAPANFACNAAGLAGQSAHVYMASAVGEDELGTGALTALESHGVSTAHVQINSNATGTVTIQIDDNGNASYTFAKDTAWDNLSWNPRWEQLASLTDAVCFGTLGQRSAPSREVFERFLKACRPDALRVFDINIRRPFFTDQSILDSMRWANVLKLNEEELPLLSGLWGVEGSVQEQLGQLADRYDLECVALTLGPDGAMLLHRDSFHQIAPVTTDVVDTVGAGDAFTATLILGLLEGVPIDHVGNHAARVASFVCSQPGATPTIPQHLKEIAASPG